MLFKMEPNWIHGNVNYDIFLPAEEEADSKGTDIRLDVKNASLNDIHLIYENSQFKQSGIVHVEELLLSGNFSMGKFNLKRIPTFCRLV